MVVQECEVKLRAPTDPKPFHICRTRDCRTPRSPAPVGSVTSMPSWEALHFVYDEAEAEEPMGSKEKWWVDLPGFKRRWLLKLSRLDEHDGTVSGEDWAEWTVHHLSNLLEVPTAAVMPALLLERRAIVSESVLHDQLEYLDHGNSVLSARFPEYDQSVQGENPGYTPAAVNESLRDVAPPAERVWPANFTAFDVWSGYLLMDAWVAGRDRHHENWATVLRGDERRLAPSFDHGNALGFQERDERRSRMLGDETHFMRWIERGTSKHFVGQPGLVELAFIALNLSSSNAKDFWLSHLAAVDMEDVESILSRPPSRIMSPVARTFVLKMLETNRRRLLNGYCST
jgi:hypothetical protein